MTSRFGAIVIVAAAVTVGAQQQQQQQQQQQPASQERQPPPIETTRPPANNENTLRPLGPDEIAPNLSFYAMDPLYKPGVPLGWAKERIEEKLDRGLVAIKTEKGVYLGWRLLKSDPADVAFNVYR